MTASWIALMRRAAALRAAAPPQAAPPEQQPLDYVEDVLSSDDNGQATVAAKVATTAADEVATADAEVATADALSDDEIPAAAEDPMVATAAFDDAVVWSTSVQEPWSRMLHDIPPAELMNMSDNDLYLAIPWQMAMDIADAEQEGDIIHLHSYWEEMPHFDRMAYVQAIRRVVRMKKWETLHEPAAAVNINVWQSIEHQVETMVALLQ